MSDTVGKQRVTPDPLRGLPESWAAATIGDLPAPEPNSLTDGPFGSKLKSEHYVASGARVIRLGNIGAGEFYDDNSAFIDNSYYAELKKHAVYPGDLLIAALADPVGRCCQVPDDLGEALVKADCLRLKPTDKVSARLLMHWLNSPIGRKAVEGLSHGIGRLRINIQDLKQVPLPLPPFAEQRRITEKVEALLTRSRRAKEALDAIPALLDRYRQSVLAAAFRGDLTAEWRAANARDTVQAILARTPAPQQPRGGREATDTVIPGVGGLAVNDPETPLPEGWGWVPLLRVARQETGHTPSRSIPDYWSGDIPWIGIRDASEHHGGVIEDTHQHVTQAGLDNSAARLLPKGTVCLSRTASVGYATIMGRDMATSQDFATWTCTDALAPHFLMYALLSEGDEIRRFGKGSTHTTIYFPEIRALHIALAPVDEQKEIVRRVQRSLAAIEAVRRCFEDAQARHATLTQSILAKAFRGELVPQDPNDEPASVLLERIRAERAAAGDRPRRGRRATVRTDGKEG